MAEISPSFYDRPNVERSYIPVGNGVPLGIELVSNTTLGLGGAYGAWGESIDNESLPALLARKLGEALRPEERLDLSALGFDRRHHTGDLSLEENLEVELSAGSQFLQAAAKACGWDPGEIDAVLVGTSGPAADDFVTEIANRAGISAKALKVSVHKACDGSVGALNLALNPALDLFNKIGRNLAEELRGKKVLVGGIEGLSRFVGGGRDKNALQLFGSAAGVIGVIPGQTMEFLVGKNFEVYDEEGVLEVHMNYPHSGRPDNPDSLVEVAQPSDQVIRVAGLMHEPEDGSPIAMAGPMGMVKLFVRTGVQVVTDVMTAYHEKMSQLGTPEKIAVAIVHHANYKINQLKAKHLEKEGIRLTMPWLLREFGNVSAASNMIAFLRALPGLQPGDHVLLDGFGAGTYYDVLVVSLGHT